MATRLSEDASAPPRAEYPIEVLHDDNSNGTVDIVAVHGLGANPDYAWVWQPKNNPPDCTGYPDKPLNWLRDLLPIEMSSAQLSCRVMTFNYNSKWLTDSPQQRLSNISDSLLDSLRNKRKDTINRPLIFVGHSFGGNLIEQAIVSASRHESDYTEIAQSTVGVLFLGTPHRGCAAATWGALIATLMPGQSTENRILKDLEEQSGTLTDRLHDFSRWLFSESIPVVCFYEQFPTNYSSRIPCMGKIMSFKELVVPENSACIDGHQKMQIYADHFKINKFYGPQDPSFQRVYPVIERMAQRAGEMLERRRHPRTIPMDHRATSGDLRKCLQEMRVTNPRDILLDVKDRKGNRTEHTCEWILKRDEFSSWAAANDPQLLCIRGSPGIGKTMMSSFLVQVLTKKVEKSTDKALAYFFYDDKNEQQRTPTAMLRSLIWQLLLQRNELFEHIRSDFEKHSASRVFKDLFENFSSLRRIFFDMLQDEQTGEVFVLIDALDECERSTRWTLLRALRELFLEIPCKGRRFKVLVTCRPEVHDIEYELKNVGTDLRMDSSEVNTDLSHYITVKVDELAGRKDYSDILKEKVKTVLKDQAGGTFLWVSLMVNELEKIRINHQVHEKLKRLPKKLDETYTRILNDNIPEESREDAQFLLLIMVAAERPLRKKEIAAIYALWKEGLMIPSQGLHDFHGIYSSCSSIIHTTSKDDDTTVNFCHQSVKDFLLENPDNPTRTWFQISLGSANFLMFDMCWCYLSSNELANGNTVIRREGNILVNVQMSDLERHLGDYPFLEYAVDMWENHAVASYPQLLNGVNINFTRAVTLCDALLLRTASEGQTQVLELLFSNNADPAVANEYGWTPLFFAVQKGNKDIMQLLLATGQVNPNLQDEDGRSPLSYAAFKGCKDIVQLLLATGQVNPDLQDEDGWSPLFYAVQKGHKDIVQVLLDTGRVNPNLQDEDGRSPLSYAAFKGRKDIVQVLLDTGQVNPNLQDEDGRSPLFYAVQKGHKDIVQVLLDTGRVNPNLQDEDGRSPLSYAAFKGRKDIVQVLLDTGQVNPNLQDEDGRSPLSYAAFNGRKDIVQLLLDTGQVNPDLQDEDGQSPLSYAAWEGNKDIIQLLLATGQVNPNLQDKDDQSPLSYAALNGHKDIFQLLLATCHVNVDS